ncbi:hypothetical protein MKW92_042233 [Papaver armeniacum]|nr:hypothetical protein MKW92_042233 [Papaver armeniacum]
MANFPEEIIVNILSRLPVKSVSRFKCVSKGWCKLIRNPKFIKTHLKHATDSNQIALMLRDCYLYSMDFDSSSSFLLNDATEVSYPFKTPSWGVELFGTSNGLVCISPDEDVFCIFNPCTGEYNKLPTTEITFPEKFTFVHKMSYGFGYDSRIDDYKMIRVVNFADEDDSCEVRVYTLGNDSWKSLGFIPYHLSYGRAPGMLANEAIHWIANPIESDRKVILAFDISSETFQEVPQPESLSEKFHVSVCSFEGLLCLMANNFQVHMDIWVMKEYGTRDSWTKLFTILQPTDIRSFEYARPLKLFKNGEVLLEKDSQKMGIYDQKHLRVRSHAVRGISRWSETEIYVKSLVSVNSGTYVGQEQTSVAGGSMNKGEKKKKKKKSMQRAEVGPCLF